MRLAIDCHNLEGNRTGVGRYLWNLLREWFNPTGSDPEGLNHAKLNSTRRHSIEFFLYFKNQVSEDVKNLSNVGCWTSHIRVLDSKSNALYKHWHLPKAVAKDDADILFCPDYVLPITGIKKYRTALTLHDIIYEARPKEYSWPSFVDRILLKWASKQSAKKADVIFCPANFTKSEIVKYYKINPNKVIVTPLAPDPVFKKEQPVAERGLVENKAAWVMKKHNIRDKFVIFVGSIFNRRFMPETIKAFIKFAKEYSDFQFLIIGKNHTSPFQDIGSIVKRANEELGRDAIIWKEYVDDNSELAVLYGRAYATLWFSSYEGFGLPLLESMACGTPVITSRASALVEVAGESALYIGNPGDTGEIFNTLNFITGNKNAMEELSRKGLERARMFSWEKAAKETLDAILRIN